MLKLPRLGVIAAAVVALVATSKPTHAAFDMTITYVSGAGGVGFPTFSTPLTSGTGPFAGGDLYANGAGVGTDLLIPFFSFTNDPVSGFFSIDSLPMFYGGNVNPITFNITITESAANYPGGPGDPLYGYSGFTVAGGTASTLLGATATFDGTGANVINFPSAPLTAGFVTYFDDTIFNSNGPVGSIGLSFDVTLAPFENINFNNLGGTGASGTGVAITPAPAAALVGLFAVPTLALIRRRNRK